MIQKTTYLFSNHCLLKTNNEYKSTPALIEITNSIITKVRTLKLTEIEDNILSIRNNKNITFYDYSQYIISPAFINCHTHIAMNYFRAVIKHNNKSDNLVENIFFKAEKILTREDVKAFAKIGAYENILNGVGLIWDHYYYGLDIAKACQEVGISAVIAPTLQDKFGPGKHMWENALNETHELFSQNQFSKSNIYSSLGPHATDTVSIELWQKIKDLAQTLNIPIHIHAAQSYDEYKRSKKLHNKTPISYLNSLEILQPPFNTILVHNIHLTKNDFKILKKSNSKLIYCPFSQMIFEFPANIIEWEKYNLNWYVGTDCVASNDSMNVQKELRFISGFPSLIKTTSGNYNIELGKERKKILSDHFSNQTFLLDKVFEGAGKLHPQFTAGSIKEGALANFVIWNKDHPAFWPAHNIPRALSMGDTTGAIHNMLIAGKKISHDGNFVGHIINSSEYMSSIKEANTRLKIILDKLD